MTTRLLGLPTFRSANDQRTPSGS